jgi:DNA topoisomerase-1
LEFKDADIQVINGRYGPYIKHAGGNYKIPKGTDASKLTLEECQSIINNSEPSKKRNKFHKKP